MSNRPTPIADNLRRLRERKYAQRQTPKASIKALTAAVETAKAASAASQDRKAARKAAKRSKRKSGAMPPPADASE